MEKMLYAAEFSALCTLENNSNSYNTELNFRVYIYILGIQVSNSQSGAFDS